MDAARLLDARFAAPQELLAADGTYAAKEHGVAVAARDARARGTYDALGVKVILVA